jgi:methyl-accepting chemotaxis protein
MNARKKVACGMVGLAIFIGIFGAVALSVVRRLGDQLNESAKLITGQVARFGAVNGDILGIRLLLRTFMYDSAVGKIAECAANASAFREKVALTQREIDQLRPLLVTDKGSQAVTAVAQGLAEYNEAGQNLIDLLQAGRSAEADRLAADRVTPTGNRLASLAGELVELQNASVKKASEEAAATVSRSTWALALLLALGLTASACFFILVRGLILRLQNISSQLSIGAGEVAAAAGQAASSGQELAQGSSQQVSAVARISSAVEEIAALTQQHRDSAREAADLMANAQKVGVTVREALGTLESAVTEFHNSNSEIGTILRSIDEIAFQTNILALNAAVEAARAGSAGAGFAVVADEVRSLAQRSAQAARDTAQFVTQNLASADSAINRVGAVKSGWGQSGSIRDKVKAMSDQIAQGSMEQDRGTQEIARSVAEVSSVTQQTASEAQEVAAAGERLNAQAGLLSKLARELNAVVGTYAFPEGRHTGIDM